MASSYPSRYLKVLHDCIISPENLPVSVHLKVNSYLALSQILQYLGNTTDVPPPQCSSPGLSSTSVLATGLWHRQSDILPGLFVIMFSASSLLFYLLSSKSQLPYILSLLASDFSEDTFTVQQLLIPRCYLLNKKQPGCHGYRSHSPCVAHVAGLPYSSALTGRENVLISVKY